MLASSVIFGCKSTTMIDAQFFSFLVVQHNVYSGTRMLTTIKVVFSVIWYFMSLW